jgi:hypothetical protein
MDTGCSIGTKQSEQTASTHSNCVTPDGHPQDGNGTQPKTFGEKQMKKKFAKKREAWFSRFCVARDHVDDKSNEVMAVINEIFSAAIKAAKDKDIEAYNAYLEIAYGIKRMVDSDDPLLKEHK